MYTLGQAARAVGKSKPTISRAISSGRISATRGLDGRLSIDPAELHRVFPPVPARSDADSGTMQRIVPPGETVALQREVELLRDQVTDLRRRLDAADEERRALTQRLLGSPDQPALGSWWRRWWR